MPRRIRLRTRLRSKALLWTAAAGALTTLNGYRPFSRRGTSSLPSMAAGIVATEQPLHAATAQALLTLRLVRKGALRTPSGWVGLGLSAASIGGLVGLHRDAQRSGKVFAAALADGLDISYPTAAITTRQLAAPNLGQRKRYLHAANLDYGVEGIGVRNQLDVWRGASVAPGSGAPVLLQIHGGAWSMGRKDSQAGPLMGHLAEHGWVCVTMNYRLSPKATWPDHIVDVKRAIAWVRAHIDEYGGDPSFIAVTGGSAGGHLSALAALSANDPAFQPGFEDADTAVQAAVPIYGLYDVTNRDGGTRPDTVEFIQRHVLKSSPVDDRQRWEQASPLCRVRADAPPFFVVHGTNDSFLPVEQARGFVDELRRVSTSPVVFAEVPRAQHAFDFMSTVRVRHMVAAIEAFLDAMRTRSRLPG